MNFINILRKIVNYFFNRLEKKSEKNKTEAYIESEIRKRELDGHMRKEEKIIDKINKSEKTAEEQTEKIQEIVKDIESDMELLLNRRKVNDIHNQIMKDWGKI
jgi:uncharacterized protein YpuA (DUF1002 family)